MMLQAVDRFKSHSQHNFAINISKYMVYSEIKANFYIKILYYGISDGFVTKYDKKVDDINWSIN